VLELSHLTSRHTFSWQLGFYLRLVTGWLSLRHGGIWWYSCTHSCVAHSLLICGWWNRRLGSQIWLWCRTRFYSRIWRIHRLAFLRVFNTQILGVFNQAWLHRLRLLDCSRLRTNQSSPTYCWTRSLLLALVFALIIIASTHWTNLRFFSISYSSYQHFLLLFLARIACLWLRCISTTLLFSDWALLGSVQIVGGRKSLALFLWLIAFSWWWPTLFIWDIWCFPCNIVASLASNWILSWLLWDWRHRFVGITWWNRIRSSEFWAWFPSHLRELAWSCLSASDSIVHITFCTTKLSVWRYIVGWSSIILGCDAWFLVRSSHGIRIALYHCISLNLRPIPILSGILRSWLLMAVSRSLWMLITKWLLLLLSAAHFICIYRKIFVVFVFGFIFRKLVRDSVILTIIQWGLPRITSLLVHRWINCICSMWILQFMTIFLWNGLSH